MHQQVELVGAMRLRPIKDKQICFIRVASFSSVSFRNLTAWHVAVLYPLSIYIIFSEDPLYHIVFSPVFRRAGVLSLEVKYDRFENRDEGTWQKTPR